MKELEIRQSCSVSQETVNMVAEHYPHLFVDANGNIRTLKVLYALGFDIKPESTQCGIYTYKGEVNTKENTFTGVYLRDNMLPAKVYPSECIYNGRLGKDYIVGKESGVILHDKRKPHWLAYTYNMYEVLQPENLKEIVSADRWLDITELAPDINPYNWGFKQMDVKGADRNIVRSPNTPFKVTENMAWFEQMNMYL